MLGNGVNQIFNPKVQDDGRKLRATPHALSMPDQKEDEARTWYSTYIKLYDCHFYTWVLLIQFHQLSFCKLNFCSIHHLP